MALNEDRGRAVTTYKTFTLNYARASEVNVHLAAVRISPNARASVDERNNALIITDTPEGIAAAERLIAELDKKPLQVMVETKIVEVILSDSLDLGIDWAYAGTNTDPNYTQTVGRRSGTGATAAPTGPLLNGTGVALPANRREAAINFGFINNTDIFNATLNALAQKGKSKILSSPKVVTMNNQQARIQVGSRIPFSVTTVAGSGTATQSFQFVDVGVILTVTPTISANNQVRVRLRPEVAFPGALSPAGPEINTRNAETEVLIMDGQTLVIGGLIDEQMRETANKVPLLGDIPVLGVFFRNNSEDKRRSELLVFVTPRIIPD
jgi:type II secretion system protein D